jgi:hypothetical protein
MANPQISTPAKSRQEEQRKGKGEREERGQATPTQSKHHHIFKWLQGLRSMSSILSSSTKTRDEEGPKTREEAGSKTRDESGSEARESQERESSVEVVEKARDVKGRGKGKGIRVVSNEEVEVEESGGGEEGGV